MGESGLGGGVVAGWARPAPVEVWWRDARGCGGTRWRGGGTRAWRRGRREGLGRADKVLAERGFGVGERDPGGAQKSVTKAARDFSRCWCQIFGLPRGSGLSLTLIVVL